MAGVVRRFYEGMRNADTAAMRGTLHTDARLFVTTMRDGQPLVRMVPVDVFLASIGGSSERLNPTVAAVPEIRVSGNVATAWASYTLQRNGQTSHCGADAFQVARTPQGWRILQLLEMQRRDGC